MTTFFPPGTIIREAAADRKPIIESGGRRPMSVVEPFIDPIHTFRSTRISEQYIIAPDLEVFSQFLFEVGLPVQQPFRFRIQNTTINTVLRVELTLPPYIRSRPPLGNVFDVPFIGDVKSQPVFLTDPDEAAIISSSMSNSGRGFLDITLEVIEDQAKIIDPPGRSGDVISFNVFPVQLTGPVFVSTLVLTPVDPNTLAPSTTLDGTRGESISDTSDVVFIPDRNDSRTKPSWISGLDGKLRNGFAPVGWRAEEDGRMYPPLTDSSTITDPTGIGPDSVGDRSTLTPLETLIQDVANVPVSFGPDTHRRGYVIDGDKFLEGNHISRVLRTIPDLLVADSVPGNLDFKILKTSGGRVSVLTVPFLENINIFTAVFKLGRPTQSSFGTGTREALIENMLVRILHEGEKANVSGELSNSELTTLAIVATVAAIITEIRRDGEGRKLLGSSGEGSPRRGSTDVEFVDRVVNTVTPDPTSTFGTGPPPPMVETVPVGPPPILVVPQPPPPPTTPGVSPVEVSPPQSDFRPDGISLRPKTTVIETRDGSGQRLFVFTGYNTSVRPTLVRAGTLIQTIDGFIVQRPSGTPPPTGFQIALITVPGLGRFGVFVPETLIPQTSRQSLEQERINTIRENTVNNRLAQEARTLDRGGDFRPDGTRLRPGARITLLSKLARRPNGREFFLNFSRKNPAVIVETNFRGIRKIISVDGFTVKHGNVSIPSKHRIAETQIKGVRSQNVFIPESIIKPSLLAEARR